MRQRPRDGEGGGSERWRGANWCSYKRATIAVCCVNLVVALYVLDSLYGSLHTTSSPDINRGAFSDLKYTKDQIKRLEESVRVRKELVPLQLVKSLKKLRKEISGKKRRWELPLPMRQMLTNEILERLRSVKNATNVTEQREAVELWHIEKLEAVKMVRVSNSTSKSSISAKETKMLKRALGSNWHKLSEEIGLWMPVDVINNEINDKPENEEEEEIIPGPPLPAECHVEPHTDYDGSAVRWGFTHHTDSAADCCQACLDQAKQAKQGEMKCNIWVYCPLESGCHSPDIYEHQHQECWLKQAYKPMYNFKDKYAESYRNSHPKAPEVVPWIAGVITA